MFGWLLVRTRVWSELAVQAALCDEYRQRAGKAERERDEAIRELEASRVAAWQRCQEVENRMLTKTLQTFGVPVKGAPEPPAPVTYRAGFDPEQLDELERTLYDFHLESCLQQGMGVHEASKQAAELYLAEKKGLPLPYQKDLGSIFS